MALKESSQLLITVRTAYDLYPSRTSSITLMVAARSCRAGQCAGFGCSPGGCKHFSTKIAYYCAPQMLMFELCLQYVSGQSRFVFCCSFPKWQSVPRRDFAATRPIKPDWTRRTFPSIILHVLVFALSSVSVNKSHDSSPQGHNYRRRPSTRLQDAVLTSIADHSCDTNPTVPSSCFC